MANFDMENDAKTQDALKDLERIEQEVVAEATASAEDFDAMGDEGKAAAAAETAAIFEEAQSATANL